MTHHKACVCLHQSRCSASCWAHASRSELLQQPAQPFCDLPRLFSRGWLTSKPAATCLLPVVQPLADDVIDLSFAVDAADALRGRGGRAAAARGVPPMQTAYAPGWQVVAGPRGACREGHLPFSGKQCCSAARQDSSSLLQMTCPTAQQAAASTAAPQLEPVREGPAGCRRGG